ncbi:MAG: hypothetical protein WC522_02365 [Candidatus Omnitrophota bacterium]
MDKFIGIGLYGVYRNAPISGKFGIGIELGIGIDTQPIMDIDIRIKTASKRKNFRLLFNLKVSPPAHN